MDILDQLPEVFICWKDETSTFLGCNDNFARLLGKTKDEIIGTQDTVEKHVKDDEEVRATGKSKLHMHESIPTPKGTLAITTNKGPLRDAEGNIIGTIATFTLD